MKNSTKRNIVRWAHLLTGGIIATYIYSPYSEIAAFQFIVKAVVIPLIILSGLWLWKGPLVRRPFKSNVSLLLLLLVSTNLAMAQETNTGEVNPKRWGIEYSPVGFGLFRISQAKATFTLNVNHQFKTELGLGFMWQPYSTTKASESFNEDGEYSALMASIGVRQYLWKGLHFEEVVNLGRGSIRNSLVDGNDYDAFVIFTQTFLGYRVDFFKNKKTGLYLIGQMGVGYVPLNTNQWPRVEENGSSVYPLGDLKVGVSF